jgi:hypothetical protein
LECTVVVALYRRSGCYKRRLASRRCVRVVVLAVVLTTCRLCCRLCCRLSCKVGGQFSSRCSRRELCTCSSRRSGQFVAKHPLHLKPSPPFCNIWAEMYLLLLDAWSVMVAAGWVVHALQAVLCWRCGYTSDVAGGACSVVHSPGSLTAVEAEDKTVNHPSLEPHFYQAAYTSLVLGCVHEHESPCRLVGVRGVWKLTCAILDS